MSVSEFRASSLIESTEILCREWSRHKISTVGRAQMDLRFSQLRISKNLTVNRLSYGANVSIAPWDRDEVLLVQMPIKGRASAVYAGGEVSIDAARYGVIDVRRVERFTCDADFDALLIFKIGDLDPRLERKESGRRPVRRPVRGGRPADRGS